jgi:hypothetical protein
VDKQQCKPGKRRQTFTQRDIQRADRAAPNRTIIIRRDGSIELVPIGESAPTKDQNEWDGVR